LLRKVSIRLDDTIYQLLVVTAKKRGEPVSAVARRILTDSLQATTISDAQDLLLSHVRKAIRLELRSIENRLASLTAKAAISSASAENLVSRVLVLLKEPNISGVRDVCRKRGVAYIREPLDQIIQAYESETGDI